MSNRKSSLAGPARSVPSGPLRGALDAPADKSVSHRSFILGALADGVTEVDGLLEGDDVLATGRACAALGAKVERTGEQRWRITGCGGRFVAPDSPLDFGNAGTGVRLMMGAVAGAGADMGSPAIFVGDASLSARPMGRIADPLVLMGAQIDTSDGRLPATLRPARLRGIDYTPPIASAQVKSAILLAGLGADGETVVREPAATRDHTESMLAAFGAPIDVERDGAALTARLRGSGRLNGRRVRVPGDPSSAAFAIAAALITPGSQVTVRGVMTNPARTGLYSTLVEMGGDLVWGEASDESGEAVADLTARHGALRGVDVPAERAPSMIDEYPVLAVIAAFAEGETRMNGLAELRAKESDRLAGTAAMLRANGVDCEIDGDTLIVRGNPKGVRGGGRVATLHDHRLAMSALVMGQASRHPVEVDDLSMIATSYPDFIDHMRALGAELETS